MPQSNARELWYKEFIMLYLHALGIITKFSIRIQCPICLFLGWGALSHRPADSGILRGELHGLPAKGYVATKQPGRQPIGKSIP